MNEELRNLLISIKVDIYTLKEELAEIKKWSKMTDSEKNAMLWAESQASLYASLPNIIYGDAFLRALKETEGDEQ